MLFQTPLLIPHFTLSFLLSDNIMADVASKQQTTALFLSTILTRTRRHTQQTKKKDKSDGKPVLCQRTISSVSRAVFFTQLNCTVSLRVYGALKEYACGTDVTMDMRTTLLKRAECWHAVRLSY
jgi:hypothetical protein